MRRVVRRCDRESNWTVMVACFGRTARPSARPLTRMGPRIAALGWAIEDAISNRLLGAVRRPVLVSQEEDAWWPQDWLDDAITSRTYGLLSLIGVSEAFDGVSYSVALNEAVTHGISRALRGRVVRLGSRRVDWDRTPDARWDPVGRWMQRGFYKSDAETRGLFEGHWVEATCLTSLGLVVGAAKFDG